MGPRFTVSIELALAIATLVFAAEAYRAATQPIGSGEAYVYDRFVRPTTRQVLASELPDRDVLYCLLEKRSVGLFHVSPFSVRLPALMFGALYLWVVWRLAHRLLGSGWLFVFAALVADTLPLRWDWFWYAGGTGAALTLVLCAVWFAVDGKYPNLIGGCLGLSVAASTSFAIPAAMIALAILALQRRWSEWTDRVLIPAVVVALIFLVLPISHSHAPEERPPELTEGQAIQVQSALAALRAAAGAEPIRIAAIPPAEAIANFYRAQHQASTWARVVRDDQSEHFDYYLFSQAEAGWVSQRHLLVVYKDADFVLATRGDAAM